MTAKFVSIVVIAQVCFAVAQASESWTHTAVATGAAPFAAAFDPSTGNACVVNQVANSQGHYTVTIVGPGPGYKVLANAVLHGTPYYWGPYPVANGSCLVPEFAIGGGQTAITMDSVLMKAPYAVTGTIVPNAQNGTVATLGDSGNVYLLTQEPDGLHIVRITPAGTQIDKFLFAQGSSSEIAYEPVHNLLYVVGASPNTGLYIIDPGSFTGAFSYTFIPGSFSNYHYLGGIIVATDGSVYLASNDTAFYTGVTRIVGTTARGLLPITNVGTIAYDPNNDTVYATATYFGGQVWTITGGVLNPVPITTGLESNPVTIAFDSVDRNLYVAAGSGDYGMYCLFPASKSVKLLGKLSGGIAPWFVSIAPGGAAYFPVHDGYKLNVLTPMAF